MLADFLENDVLFTPVLDQTGLTNMYDLDLTWPVKGRNWANPTRRELDRILLEQLGLEIVSTNEPLEMVVVEKVK